MRALELCSYLTIFLEEDMYNIVSHAEQAASQSSSLSDQEKQSYEHLQEKYVAAKRTAMEAQNLLYAQEAVAGMQEVVFRCKRMCFFGPDKEEK